MPVAPSDAVRSAPEAGKHPGGRLQKLGAGLHPAVKPLSLRGCRGPTLAEPSLAQVHESELVSSSHLMRAKPYQLLPNARERGSSPVAGTKGLSRPPAPGPGGACVLSPSPNFSNLMTKVNTTK